MVTSCDLCLITLLKFGNLLKHGDSTIFLKVRFCDQESVSQDWKHFKTWRFDSKRSTRDLAVLSLDQNKMSPFRASAYSVLKRQHL